MNKFILITLLASHSLFAKELSKDLLFDKALNIYAQNRSGDLPTQLITYQSEIQQFCKQDQNCISLLSHALNVRINIKYVRLAVTSNKKFKSKLKELIKQQSFYLRSCESENCQAEIESFCELYKDSREFPEPLCLGLHYFKSQVTKKYLRL